MANFTLSCAFRGLACCLLGCLHGWLELACMHCLRACSGAARRTEDLRRAHSTFQDKIAREKAGEAERRAEEERRRRNEVPNLPHHPLPCMLSRADLSCA